jgi:hypothetical protein
MSTGKSIKTTVDSGSPVTTQNHSPDQSYYSVNLLYILSLKGKKTNFFRNLKNLA